MTTTVTFASSKDSEGIQTGRIAALSWPATRRDKIIDIVGFDDAPPSPKPLAAYRPSARSAP